MEEVGAPRYWCHMCSQTVDPIMEIESVKCPICQSGFVEEVESPEGNDNSLNLEFGGSDPDRVLSLLAPILLGTMGSRHRRRRFRHIEFEEGENDSDDYENHRPYHDGETDLDAIHGRRRSTAAMLHYLRNVRAMIESSADQDNRQGDRERERERVIVINPFNQSIIIQGSRDPNNETITRAPVGSLGDYFLGPGLDLLLQHLSENDPNRYGTPPAHKEAVEALPTVRIMEKLQCSVCLDDYEIGEEAKEMPCKHKFHSKCILPWLELHSSCPICRHQLPCDESKLDSSQGNSNGETDTSNDDAGSQGGNERNERGRQFSRWPFNLFSTSNSGNSNANPSTSGQNEN